MLDSTELAKRLRTAMDLRVPPLPSVELAAKMGVSKQVVYEWRTTGRISKGRLLDLARATEMPLEYYLEPDRGTTPATKAIWLKLGKAFARAALALILVTPPIADNNAEAAFNIIAYTLHIAALLRRLSYKVSQAYRAFLTRRLRVYGNPGMWALLTPLS